MTMQTETNKETVKRLYAAIAAGDVDAFDDLVVPEYRQHNPQAGDGREAVKAFFRSAGPVELQLYRVVAEGDFVMGHVHYKTFNMAAVDIWRFNDEGKAIEHWDVLQTIPETTASGNDMFAQLS